MKLISGFTDLGNTDEFSTEMLEWRLGTTAVLNYAGDLMTPPDAAKGVYLLQWARKFKKFQPKKTREIK